MNITIYIAIAIILILIIFYFCFRAYLINTQSTTITVKDNDPINHFCIYNNANIIDCNYLANGKKYAFTKILKKVINDHQKNNFSNDSEPLVFNSENFNLPKNGVLKIRFVCDRNNKEKNKFNNKNIHFVQNKYNLLTKEYDSASYLANQTNIIPIHSSSTQNPIYNNTPAYIHNIPLYSNIADLNQLRENIDKSIDDNKITSMINNIEKYENAMSNSFVKDSPNSYLTTIFNNKYPSWSTTSKLAYIDPEYIIGGLRGDARLLD
jgi:uncharacterized protein YneF (UPF0154 family)